MAAVNNTHDTISTGRGTLGGTGFSCVNPGPPRNPRKKRVLPPGAMKRLRLAGGGVGRRLGVGGVVGAGGPDGRDDSGIAAAVFTIGDCDLLAGLERGQGGDRFLALHGGRDL